MTIYPAIDILGGSAVRLERGDYSRVTVYNDDPVSVARGFGDAGAAAAHIVDLEGAKTGKPVCLEIIRAIASESGLPEIQVGGGIRDVSAVEKYLRAGVRRVILGTAAVSDPGFLKDMVRDFGGAIAVSVDIRDGFAAIKGWTELSRLDALTFCKELQDLGVATLICTDISKDGLLGGTNMELYKTMRKSLSLRLIASGGISALDEISALSALGMDGAILGKALYAGNIKLSDALKQTQ